MHNVLFYQTASGNEIVLDFIRQLSAEEKKVVGEDLKAVQIGFPMGLPLCRPLGDGLYEIRSSLPSKREFRLIFSSIAHGNVCWWCMRSSRRARSCRRAIWIWRGSDGRIPLGGTPSWQK